LTDQLIKIQSQGLRAFFASTMGFFKKPETSKPLLMLMAGEGFEASTFVL
jgi:hypothetical protein